MKKMFVLMMLMLATLTFAQTIGGGVFLGLPQGNFKKEIDRVGYGINASATITTPDRVHPVSFGLNVGYMVYGSNTEKRPLSNTIREVTVDVTQRNSLVNFHLLMRVSPVSGDVKPYLEFLGGGEYIFTTTEVESEYDVDNVFESTNYDDFAWSYGGSLGIMFKIAGGPNGMGSVMLDLKAQYLMSSEAEYLKEGDIRLDQNNNIYYTPSRSSTDYLALQLGVVVSLR